MLKKVLFIDLNTHKFETKSLTELNPYIGGVGVGLKLLLDHIESDPLIFSIGPLNGAFPFASKTSVVFHNGGAPEDIYIGGSLSFRIKFCGLDSIVIHGKSKEPVILDIHDETVHFRPIQTNIESLGLPGKRSVIKPIVDKLILDQYFTAPEKFLETKVTKKNVRGIVITGTKAYDLYDKERYTEQFTKIISRTHDLSVSKSTNPSCSGCPMGCDKSKVGELGGNVLVHSLVACEYAASIYSNIGVVFSCLNVLGYDYTHEDIEALPSLIEKVLNELTV